MIVVLFLLTLVVSGIVNAIGGSVSDSFVGYAISDLIVRVLLSPLSAIAATVMYVELRRVKGEPLAAGRAAARRCAAGGGRTRGARGLAACASCSSYITATRRRGCSPSRPGAAGPRAGRVASRTSRRRPPPTASTQRSSSAPRRRSTRTDIHPWLRPEQALLAELLERETPVLGVCFGSQLLARTAGAQVRPAAAPEIGWHEVELTAEGTADPAARLPSAPLREPAVAPLRVAAAPARRGAGAQRALPPGVPARAPPRLGRAVPPRGHGGRLRLVARQLGRRPGRRGDRARPRRDPRRDRLQDRGLERGRPRARRALPG